MSDTIIYTYGGGEALAAVFNGIAAMSQGDSINSLIKISGILGFFWASVLGLIRGSLSEGTKWFMWFIISVNALVIPKSTVLIKDELSNKPFKVDNVPFALGYTAGLLSGIGHGLTKEMEKNFTKVDDLLYHKTGTVFASKLVSRARHFKITDTRFNENMSNFVNRCIVYDAMIGIKYTIKDLRNSTNIWELVKEHSSQILGFMYKYPKSGNSTKESEIITCRKAAENLNNEWKDELQKAKAIYGSQISGNLHTDIKRDFDSRLQGTFNYLTGISGSANEILRQQMMINVIDEASHNKVNELGGSNNYATTKALMQQKSTYQITGELAGRLLPTMKIVFECLSYGSFFIMIIILLLPSGIKSLTSYLGILLWIQMWPPLYSILNMLMNFYAKSETSDFVGNAGLTIVTSVGISEVNSGIEALAGYLSMSIPFISYAIIKGGAASFMHLASHLGSAIQSSASHSASETTAGNISLGNYSQGMQSYNSSSAFQHNTSPYFNSGQHKQTLDSGVIQSNQADGSVVMTGGVGTTISSGANHMSIQGQTSERISEGLSHANSTLDSKSTEMSTAENAFVRKTTDYVQSMVAGSSSGEQFNLKDSAGDRHAINDTLNLANSLRHDHGFTAKDAANTAVAFSLGAKLPGPITIGGNASGGYSKEMSSQQAMGLAKSIATNKDYSANNEVAFSTAKDINYGENQSESKSLGESVSSSYDKVQSSREAHSVAQQEVDTYTKALDRSQSSSFNNNQNIDQAFIEYLSHKPNLNGSGEIGMHNAYDMIHNGKGSQTLLNQYKNEFIEQRANNLVSSVKDDTSDQFTNKSAQMNQDSSIKDHYKGDQIKEFAGKHNVKKGMVNNAPVKIATAHIDGNKNMIDKGKSSITQEQNKTQDYFDKKDNQSNATRTIKKVDKDD